MPTYLNTDARSLFLFSMAADASALDVADVRLVSSFRALKAPKPFELLLWFYFLFDNSLLASAAMLCLQGSRYFRAGFYTDYIDILKASASAFKRARRSMLVQGNWSIY